MGQAPSGFPRASNPADQEPTTHVEVGTGHEHGPELRLRHHQPNLQSARLLATCDLASQALPPSSAPRRLIADDARGGGPGSCARAWNTTYGISRTSSLACSLICVRPRVAPSLAAVSSRSIRTFPSTRRAACGVRLIATWQAGRGLPFTLGSGLFETAGQAAIVSDPAHKVEGERRFG